LTIDFKAVSRVISYMSNTSEQVGTRARELFRQHYCCAESVLLAVAENCGITSGLIPAIATGLCGGVGRTCRLCGAVSGGVLGLNLVFGRSTPLDKPDAAHRAVQALLKEFEGQFGNLDCEKLLGCRLDTPEGQGAFFQKLRAEKCEPYVEAAARIASEIIVKQTGASGSACACGCKS
jgi:C_GCAxxG_C_C family probable redox protein